MFLKVSMCNVRVLQRYGIKSCFTFRTRERCVYVLTFTVYFFRSVITLARKKLSLDRVITVFNKLTRAHSSFLPTRVLFSKLLLTLNTFANIRQLWRVNCKNCKLRFGMFKKATTFASREKCFGIFRKKHPNRIFIRFCELSRESVWIELVCTFPAYFMSRTQVPLV